MSTGHKKNIHNGNYARGIKYAIAVIGAGVSLLLGLGQLTSCPAPWSIQTKVAAAAEHKEIDIKKANKDYVDREIDRVETLRGEQNSRIIESLERIEDDAKTTRSQVFQILKEVR